MDEKKEKIFHINGKYELTDHVIHYMLDNSTDMLAISVYIKNLEEKRYNLKSELSNNPKLLKKEIKKLDKLINSNRKKQDKILKDINQLISLNFDLQKLRSIIPPDAHFLKNDVEKKEFSNKMLGYKPLEEVIIKNVLNDDELCSAYYKDIEIVKTEIRKIESEMQKLIDKISNNKDLNLSQKYFIKYKQNSEDNEKNVIKSISLNESGEILRKLSDVLTKCYNIPGRCVSETYMQEQFSKYDVFSRTTEDQNRIDDFIKFASSNQFKFDSNLIQEKFREYVRRKSTYSSIISNLSHFARRDDLRSDFKPRMRELLQFYENIATKQIQLEILRDLKPFFASQEIFENTNRLIDKKFQSLTDEYEKMLKQEEKIKVEVDEILNRFSLKATDEKGYKTFELDPDTPVLSNPTSNLDISINDNEKINNKQSISKKATLDDYKDLYLVQKQAYYIAINRKEIISTVMFSEYLTTYKKNLPMEFIELVKESEEMQKQQVDNNYKKYLLYRAKTKNKESLLSFSDYLNKIMNLTIDNSIVEQYEMNSPIEQEGGYKK